MLSRDPFFDRDAFWIKRCGTCDLTSDECLCASQEERENCDCEATQGSAVTHPVEPIFTEACQQ